MSKTAVVFPGQGSQSIGMLASLSARFPIILQLFSSVSDSLGYDLWSLVQMGPEAKLNQTEFTQVAMLTADVAVFQVLQQQGMPMPAMMAGHSLGEYAALVCSGALSLQNAATLVSLRGQLMQDAIPLGYGSMAAIVGLSDEEVERLCDEVSVPESVVTPANYNAIGQVVIAGHTEAVLKAILQAEVMGAKLAKLIPVSVPCHCSLLRKAADDFENGLAHTRFHVPSVSVISNVDLSIYQSVEQIRRLLKEQLYSPVRWVETIQAMRREGIEYLVECGPGKVLTGLIKRIDKSLKTISVSDEEGMSAMFGGDA
ncbi:MAG: ACP S-malonyltransferase [Legionellales bacterium]|nr:ACP S-malonyltransferase [Legionellales bacterium]